jgi:hypothetical protein
MMWKKILLASVVTGALAGVAMPIHSTPADAARSGCHVLALAALLGAAIGLGAEVIHWLETGTWAVGKTLAEAWPALAERVAAMKWTGAQHMALWVVAQSLTLVYAAFAVVCLLLWFVVVELSDE